MSKIKCPKCNSNMINDCCVKCGYMSNGNFSGSFTLPDKYEDLKLYNKDFEKLNMNENKFFVFIFQSSYVAYQDHFFAAILIKIIDSIITIGMMLLLHYIFFEVLYKISGWFIIFFYISVLFYFFIKRIIYVMFANIICLKLDKFKIKKLKEKYDNYKVILKNNKNTSIISLCASIFINFIILSVSIFLLILWL